MKKSLIGLFTYVNPVSSDPIKLSFVAALLTFLGIPSDCMANGVVTPAREYFAIPNIVMFIILVWIIFLEAQLISGILENHSMTALLWPVTKANIISTLIGIPVSVVYYIHNIPDWEGFLVWISIIITTIFFTFTVSVISEYMVLKSILKNENSGVLKKSVLFANLHSYVLFIIAMTILSSQELYVLYARNF